VVPTLRGWPPTGGVNDCAGKQVDEVIRALDWLAGEPGLNPRRLYLVGYSQNAQVALLAATRGAQVRAVAAFAPVSDIASWGAKTTYPGIRKYVKQECGGPDAWLSRDPLAAAGDLHLAVLMVHGSLDKRVPTEQSVSLYRRLREPDRPVRLEQLPDTGHYIGAVLRPELGISFFRDLGADDSRSTAEIK
jgi:dipeptidyl aminopeptidase/acylaminoacyl peptidase